MLPPWGSLFFYSLMTSHQICNFLIFLSQDNQIMFFPSYFVHREFIQRAPAICMPNEIQSPKEEHHWRPGKYMWVGRFANYYAVCTSLPSHNCSFAIEFSWVFNFLCDIPFPHLHIAICHLKKNHFSACQKPYSLLPCARILLRWRQEKLGSAQ